MQLGNDPNGEDRILVKVPTLDSQSQGIWTRIATLDAGNNRGSFFRPEIGDEVVLGFLNDDPRDAIVLGMLNSKAKPAPLQASDNNHQKGFLRDRKSKLPSTMKKNSSPWKPLVVTKLPSPMRIRELL